mgnify:CR=1 FL=1
MDGDSRLQGVLDVTDVIKAVEIEEADLAGIVRDSYPEADIHTKLEKLIPLCIANDSPVAILNQERHFRGVISRIDLICAVFFTRLHLQGRVAP